MLKKKTGLRRHRVGPNVYERPLRRVLKKKRAGEVHLLPPDKIDDEPHMKLSLKYCLRNLLFK